MTSTCTIKQWCFSSSPLQPMIWWNMFPCIQRCGSLIVPMVRSSFRIVPLSSVIESHSLFIQTGTNQQGKELFVMAVRSASGDTLPGNLTIIPSGQKWVFHSIYKYAFPLLYSVQVCARNHLVLTDEDPSEYSPMENTSDQWELIPESQLNMCLCVCVSVPLQKTSGV
jgi:hypothetical protein